MARLPDPTGALGPEAQALYDKLQRERGHVDGMYRALLLHPELAVQIRSFRNFLCEDGALPAAVREFAILAVARKFDSPFMWSEHVDTARSAGVSDASIALLARRAEPSEFSGTEALTLVVVDNVLDRTSISADAQNDLARAVHAKGVVELVVLCGFYESVATISKVFDIPLPSGAEDPRSTAWT